MKILGIDYGTKNIGLALSDETAGFAGALPIQQNYGLERAVAEVSALCTKEHVAQILLGSPMQNPDSPMFKEIAKFGTSLAEASGLPLKYWDESFSSSTLEAGMRGKARKSSDSLVARNLLQEYLDYLKDTQK